MIPRLFTPGKWVTSGFEKFYVGTLHDAISCKVTQELDTDYVYTLELKYPASGDLSSQIQCRSIIQAAADAVHSPQLFEVYKVTVPIDGIITAYAHHISYMLASIPVPVFQSAQSPANALKQIGTYSNAVYQHGFTFTLDPDSKIANSDKTMTIDIPKSVRSALAGSEGSFVDIFGGELEFDEFTVTVRDRIGRDTNVKIQYGFNMTAFKQEENVTSVYTGIYPYATSSIMGDDGEYITNTITLPEHIIYASEDPEFNKVKVVDLTSKFIDSNGISAEITEENLREAANEYISENQWGVPAVNISVSFVPLDQTEEYKNAAGIEQISLGDTVKVEYSKVGITATARCVRTVYDSLLERYDTIEIGKVKKSIFNTIAQMRRDIRKIRRI